MKKIFSTFAISISVMMAASTAIAAPQDHANHHDKAMPTQQHKNTQQHPNNHGADVKRVATQNKPHHNWNTGNKFPNDYRGAGYKVNYQHNKKLSKPGKNQQWYKADNQYVLVDTTTYVILKVLGL
ncbi:RcnB family protein [Acinetobacter piscicola]|uniref:RcnB family protein n=1 Tax=Acinetobacter piscicola TaxID=2006115 RepID=UPI000B7CA21D|nr:RcnB family protein [Acinetobacter piscicola]